MLARVPAPLRRRKAARTGHRFQFNGGETKLCHNAVDRHLATRPDVTLGLTVKSRFVSERENVDEDICALG